MFLLIAMLPVSATSVPESIEAEIFQTHLWGTWFPVDRGGPTIGHYQICARCNAKARRVKGRKAGKGVTVLLPDMPKLCISVPMNPAT